MIKITDFQIGKKWCRGTQIQASIEPTGSNSSHYGKYRYNLLYIVPIDQLSSWYNGRVPGVVSSNPKPSHFFIFLNFMFLKLAITPLRGFARSTDFHILIYIPTGRYHININTGVCWSLSPNLLSKITKFSPKNLRFFPVKIFWWVPATFQSWHIDHRLTAVLKSYQTQNFF